MDKYTQRGVDGSVDMAASANAYTKALSEWCTQNEVASDTIETAVEAVFDRFDARMPMPALIGLALQELNAAPESHKTLTNRVRAYLKGQCAENTGRIDVMKGVGGGVLRLARPGQEVPARAAKKSA